MATYLPASPAQLRSKISELDGRPEDHFSSLKTVTECLMMLGELNGFATN